MNPKKLLLALAASVAAGACMPTWAQDRGYHNDGYNRHDARDDRRQRDEYRDERYQRDDRYQRGERKQAGRYNQQWREARDRDRDRQTEGGWGRTADFHSGYDGYGPDHNMHRGEPLPRRYRNHQYIVDNYRAHHLSTPPRGHHWVQVGADYVLVAAATGLIVQAVMGH